MSAFRILMPCVLISLFAGSQACSRTPGFSVTKTTDDAQDQVNNKGDVVIFNSGLTNEDGAYDFNTGKATIRISGMYFIQFTITSIRKNNTPGDALFALMLQEVGSVDETPLVKCENDPREDHQEVSCTNAIFLRLYEGDRLWITLHSIGPEHRNLLKGNGQCSFTGFRIG